MAKKETLSPAAPMLPMLKTVEQMSKVNRCISLLLFIASYMPAWVLGTIWAPFKELAPQKQAIKKTPRTHKNVVFMWVSGVF